MGLILASFFVVPAVVGWLAMRYSKAARYPHSGVVRLAAWLLGAAACVLAAWFLGRADEYLGEASSQELDSLPRSRRCGGSACTLPSTRYPSDPVLLGWVPWPIIDASSWHRGHYASMTRRAIPARRRTL